MMSRENRYALVSMPWFWAYLPSIQLAIVAEVLARSNIRSDTFEFYADFAEATGINLYKAIANGSAATAELLFSQFYFEDHGQQYRSDRPSLGLGPKEVEDAVFDFLSPVVEDHLDRWYAEVDWSRYSTVCFSLTASQTAPSMAMAKRIKADHPEMRIVFGGSSCAGEMGRATARVCPEVDVVVHGEAESTLPELVEALAGRRDLAAVPGISWRKGDEVVTNARAPLHRLGRSRGPLKFDGYFKRAAGSRLLAAYGVWIPFESSRGCWYGEKSQCTFCGLNEIIQYRERGSGGLLEELETYERDYGAKRFFAVDLIMPRSFFDDFLPTIAEAKKDWTIFYEIKSNMNRREIERLAAGKVDWIQPGIESLDDDVLRLMRKGVSAAHNIQTLKWTKEFSILPGWNLITGFPREKGSSYFAMAEDIPKLHHLTPPNGVGDFEVHRFSPYFEAPAKHGIELLGAAPSYRAVYPIPDEDLDDLVYRHGYRLLEPPDPELEEGRKALLSAVLDWRRAAQRGAAFTVREKAGGNVELFDSRTDARGARILFAGAPGRLLLFLDGMKPETRLADLFRAHDAESFAELGGSEGIADTVREWLEGGILIRKSGFILALPVRTRSGRRSKNRKRRETHGKPIQGAEGRRTDRRRRDDQGVALQSPTLPGVEDEGGRRQDGSGTRSASG